MAYGKLRINPRDFDKYSPIEFFNAWGGYDDEQLEILRMVRWQVWASLVGPGYADKDLTPDKLIKLPGDISLDPGPAELKELETIRKEMKRVWSNG